MAVMRCWLFGHDWHGQSYAGCVTCQRCGRQVPRHIADRQYGDGWVWLAAVVSFCAAFGTVLMIVGGLMR